MAERYQAKDDHQEHTEYGKDRVRYGAGHGDVAEELDALPKPGGFSPTLGPWGQFPPYSSTKH